jgi:hypothetical protein
MDKYDNISPDTQRLVRAWMTRFHQHYANSTLLAEACGDDLDLVIPGSIDAAIPEDVYDIALEFYKEDI